MGPVFPNRQKSTWIGERTLYFLINAGACLLELDAAGQIRSGPMDPAARAELRGAVDHARELIGYFERAG